VFAPPRRGALVTANGPTESIVANIGWQRSATIGKANIGASISIRRMIRAHRKVKLDRHRVGVALDF
jgi:hypothetical protein